MENRNISMNPDNPLDRSCFVGARPLRQAQDRLVGRSQETSRNKLRSYNRVSPVGLSGMNTTYAHFYGTQTQLDFRDVCFDVSQITPYCFQVLQKDVINALAHVVIS